MIRLSIRDNQFICLWFLWNGLFLSILAIASILGWTIPVILMDKSHISVIILVTFFIAWIFSLHRALWVHKSLNNNQLSDFSFQIDNNKSNIISNETAYLESLQTFLSRKLAILDYTPKLLVMMGMVGSVIGIILGMMGMSGDLINNPDAAGRAMAELISGIATGFIATAIGSIGALWIQFNEQMTSQATSLLYERILKNR